MSTSTVPAALDALLAAWRGADDVPDQVLDGPPVTDLEPESVMVGYAGDPTTPGVEATDTAAGLRADAEDYTVHCLVNVWSGDTGDTPIKRTRVYQIIDGLDAVLRADRSLGGAVMSARLAAGDLAQQQIPEGLAVACRVDIAVKAFRA